MTGSVAGVKLKGYADSSDYKYEVPASYNFAYEADRYWYSEICKRHADRAARLREELASRNVTLYGFGAGPDRK